MGSFSERARTLHTAAPCVVPQHKSINDDYSDYPDPLHCLKYVQLNLVQEVEAFVTHSGNISIKSLVSSKPIALKLPG